MTPIEIRLYSWDFHLQFGDLLDFIEFSEKNLEWQRRDQLQSLDKRAKLKKYDADEYFSERDNIRHRFDVRLAQKIRYSGIMSLHIILEWAAKFLEIRGTKPLPDQPKRVNRIIYVFRSFFQEAKCSLEHNLEELEKIIKIRNCIVHAGGIVADYKFGDEITEILEGLDGFEIPDGYLHIPSGLIHIEKGAIEEIISRTKSWIPDFIEECRQQNLITISDTD